ncbi:MAG: PEP-CTERM sorting domain-containing protein [Bdellovibrionota bacterium]
MKGSSLWFRSFVRSAILSVLIIASSGSVCRATPVFHEDTQYQLSGSFFMGALGLLTVLSETSVVHYDSVLDELFVQAVLSGSDSTRFDLSMTLGQVRAIPGGVEFAFPNGSYNPPPQGHIAVGSFSPRTDFSIFQDVIRAHSLLTLYSIGFPATILASGNDLYFNDWIQLTGAPLPINVVGNPNLKLTAATSSVPEPLTGGLLSIGLLSAAVFKRRCRRI